MRTTVMTAVLLVSLVACGWGPDSAHGAPEGIPSQTSWPVSAIGFLAGQPRLVVITRDRLVVWDVDRGEVVRRQELDNAYAILDRALSPDGRQLMLSHGSVSRSSFEARVLDVESGATITLRPPASGTSTFAITPDGATVMRTTSTYGTAAVDVSFWRLPSVEPFASSRIEGTEVGPVRVAISPAGDRFAFGTHRRTRENPNPAGAIGRIRICESATGRVLATMETPEIPRALMFSRDGAELYWGTDGDAEVHVADAASGKEVTSFTDRLNSATVNPGRGGIGGAVHLMAVTPDWARMITASPRELAVKIWNPASHLLIHTITVGQQVSAIAASADGSYLAVGSMAGGVDIWNLREPFSLVRSLELR